MGSQRDTRLTRAVQELTEALGERRFVLVYESTHPDAECESLHFHGGRTMGFWELRGMCAEGSRHFGRKARRYRRRG